MFFPFVVSAQKEETWLEASMEAKLNLRANLAKAGVPISSPVMRSYEKAVPMSANIKGWDQLVLTASGTPDGTAQDWSAFVNARLIKEDGSVVWLDELEPAYQKTGYDQVYKNIGVFGNPLVIGGKKYAHGIFCHADALVIYNLDKKFVRFETEVGIVDKLTQGSVAFGILNKDPQQAAKELFNQYPHEIGVLAADAGGLESWMVTQGEEAETQMIASILPQLKDASHYKKELENLSGATAEERFRNAFRLYAQVRSVLDIQQELEWLNIEAVKLAFADMKKQKGYDIATYEPMFNELLLLCQKGFDGIYSGDEQAIANAGKALANRRAILLGNTLLDVDRVVASRYKLGAEARQVMSPSLGTQSNNWSNQSSAPRSGFNADIVELTNLRGDVQVRSVYAPANGSPVSDLKLHWDGDRVMFTQTTENKHWNVFEVKLDGTGLRPMVECPEPDIEFYDGTYLPDGRVIAVSNIGYQGVPCVSGSDAVGNMMLFNPEDKSLRRLTFDQDANWNPVITHNGNSFDPLELEMEVVFSKKLTSGYPGYSIQSLHFLSPDVLEYNLKIEAPILVTDTVDITCTNLTWDESQKAESAIMFEASDETYSVFGMLSASSIKVGTYDSEKATVELTNTTTGKSVTALITTVVIAGNPLKKEFTVEVELLGDDSNMYLLHLSKSETITGFENLEVQTQVQKLLNNGQLIIIRGDEMFNAQGVRF